MSDFKHHDGDTDDTDIVLDEDFDPDTFVFSMAELDGLRRPEPRRDSRSARALLELRREERWLREQLSDFDEDLLH